MGLAALYLCSVSSPVYFVCLYIICCSTTSSADWWQTLLMIEEGWAINVWGAHTKGLVMDVGEPNNTNLDVPSRTSIACSCLSIFSSSIMLSVVIAIADSVRTFGQ